jgi:ABC-type dipeptide/oligopeptide/nickel transport system permease component
LIIPFALIVIHFLAFAYATAARPIRAARTPYLRESIERVPLWDAYTEHIQQIWTGEVADVPGPSESLGEMLREATKASLALLIPAMLLGTGLGVLVGIQAVRNQPPAVKRWLTPVVTVGLATPTFYLGSLGILAIVYYMIWRGASGGESPLPINGFGWDRHLIMPILVLTLRPTVQIAQVVSGLMSGELRKDYVMSERSFGFSWRNIRWKYGMKNILAAAKWLGHVHVAEPVKRSYPGNDDFDFTDFFTALRQARYNGRISVECSFNDFDRDIEIALRTIKAYPN